MSHQVSRQSARSTSGSMQQQQQQDRASSTSSSHALQQLDSAPPPRHYELPRIGTANSSTGGGRTRVIPKGPDFRAWERDQEPLAERHSPRFFLSQRQPKPNPYPSLYRGKATQHVQPVVPVSPRKAVSGDMASAVAMSTAGGIGRMEASILLPQAPFPDSPPTPSNNSKTGAAGGGNTAKPTFVLGPAPKTLNRRGDRSAGESSCEADLDELEQIFPSPLQQQQPHKQSSTGSSIGNTKTFRKKEKQQQSRRPVDSDSDENCMEDDEFLRAAILRRKEQAEMHRQMQLLNESNSASDEFGSHQKSKGWDGSGDQDQQQQQQGGDKNANQDGITDLLQQASASALSRRCYELLRRLFILQNSERSMTRCFLDRLPSSEVTSRIEAILKRSGASRHMSQEDFHLVLNQALCPSCKRVQPIMLANDDVRTVATAKERASLAEAERKKATLTAQRRRLGEPTASEDSPRRSIAGGLSSTSTHNSNVTAVYGSNESGDHITQAESKLLFSLFESNGIVGLQQISEGFDLLLRGQEFALLAYTRKICVDQPDASEKESTVTVLEIEWMLSAVVGYFHEDEGLRKSAHALIAALWKEAHQGCVTRRTFRVAVAADPLLHRAVAILPKFGSKDDFALRPEEERKPLQPDPVDMIELMVNGGGVQQQQHVVGAANSPSPTFGGGFNMNQPVSLDASIMPPVAGGFLPALHVGGGGGGGSHPSHHPTGMSPYLGRGGAGLTLQRKGSVLAPVSPGSPESPAKMTRKGSSVEATTAAGGRKKSVVGRGLAFESVDIHDPLFKADLHRSKDTQKQSTAREVGDPTFFVMQSQLYVKVGDVEQPIFDVRS